jgi:hypothetical protein
MIFEDARIVGIADVFLYAKFFEGYGIEGFHWVNSAIWGYENTCFGVKGLKTPVFEPL